MMNKEKYELPEVPLNIHNLIQQEVEKQLADCETIDFSAYKKRKWSKRRICVLVIAGVLMTSTIAAAGANLLGIHIQRDGKYGLYLGIEDPEKSLVELPEKVQGIHYEMGYIPEGMIRRNNNLYYEEANSKGGISVWDYLLDSKDINKNILEKGVIEYEKQELNGYDSVYVKYFDFKEDGTYDKRIYLLYPEAQRVILVYGGDDVSKEMLLKFTENLKIINTEDMLETKALTKWSDLWKTGEKVEGIYEVKGNKLKIKNEGETINITAPYGNFDATAEIAVRLDQVIIADDFQQLQDEFIPNEWYDLLDENKKLKENHLYYMKRGDGIRTLDKVVNEKDVNQKVVYVSMTYTNLSKTKLTELIYHGKLLYIQKEKNKYCFYNPFGQGKEYDYVLAEGVPGGNWWEYFRDEKDLVDGPNYIEILEVGESIRVEMAWIVNENDLDNLYLNVSDSTKDEYAITMTTNGIYKLTD